MSDEMKCCPRCGKIGYGITTNGCSGCPNDFTYHVGFGIKEPAPVEAERISDLQISLAIENFSKLAEYPLNSTVTPSFCRITGEMLKQQQKDLSELKAECLPWLQALTRHISAPNETLEALIQKLGGTK